MHQSQIQRLQSDPIEEAIEIDDFAPLSAQIVSLIQTKMVFTDIFIHENSPMMVKRASGIYALSAGCVTKESITQFFDELFNQVEPNWKEILHRRAFDRAVNLEKARIRANCFYFDGRKRMGCVIRRFPTVPLALSEIGLSPHAEAFAKLRNGLVLVIGDTCQGKSTTLASLLDEINKNRQGHILTIEDPIETIVPERKCLITQREVGEYGDVDSFYVGAQDAFRQKPDVVMIGEIRNAETANEVLTLAESGPLVFASMHAKSPEIGLWKLSRLLGGGAQSQALAQVLKGVIYQTLLPSKVSESYHLATETLTINTSFVKAIEEMNLLHIRKLLSESDGCNTLNSDLKKLALKGNISYEDAARVTTDKEGWFRMLKQAA